MKSSLNVTTEQRIRESLEYNPTTGVLRWKQKRPLTHFRDTRTYRSWHTRYAGTVAGSIAVHGYLQVKCGEVMLAHRVAWFLAHNEWPNHGKSRDD